MRAKRSLGQHFLKSERALSVMIETGQVEARDTILEIGPGEGALTRRLLETGARVIAVEKDDQLFELLKQKFKKEIESGQLTLIHDDILEFNVAKLKIVNWKLIANIPYNITGAILKKFLGADCQPERTVLLVQKEVAKRIVGKPHSAKASRDKESILSISVKAYGAPRYVETVKAGSFVPMPKVDSAIMAIENISKRNFQEFREDKFFKILRTGFRSKRKKLLSNLAAVFGKDRVKKTFQELGLDNNLRAEDANLEIWQKLAKNLLDT